VGRAAHSVKAKFCSECGSQTAASGTPAEYKQVTVLFADVSRVASSTGEVVADARAWIAAERQILPAIAAVGVLRAESVGVEHQRVVPQCRVVVHRVGPDQRPRSGFDPVAVDLDLLYRDPA
jgi:predicted kinase